MERGEERHLRGVAERLAQRDGAVRGQFGHQPVGDGRKPVVLLRLGRRLRRGADGGGPAVVLVPPVGAADVASDVVVQTGGRLRLDRKLVLGPDVAALDPQGPVGHDADERTRARDLLRVERDRTVVQLLHRRLELGQAMVLLLGELVGGVGLDLVHLLPERGERRLLPAVRGTASPRSRRRP